MDFNERIFGFAPDGGSGSLEFLLFAIPVVGIAYLVVRRRQRPKRKVAGTAAGPIGRAERKRLAAQFLLAFDDGGHALVAKSHGRGLGRGEPMRLGSLETGRWS